MGWWSKLVNAIDIIKCENHKFVYEKNLTTSEVTTHYFLGDKEVAYRKGTTLEYLHSDHLGSTSVTSDSSGAQVAKVAYFPFGICRNSTGNLDTDKLFTGQRLDDTGLYYYNARYYDATIGRFISPDSLVPNPSNPQSLNRYSYCLNNPLRYTDPSGHGEWDALFEGIQMYQAVMNWTNNADMALAAGIKASRAFAAAQAELDAAKPVIDSDSQLTAYVETGDPRVDAGEVIVETIVVVAVTVYECKDEIADAGKAIGRHVSNNYKNWWRWLSRSESSNDDALDVDEEDGGTVQTGGNTVKPGTAKELNKYNDKDLTPRDWGRALEKLKKDNGVPKNDHGKIKRNGDYYDNKGEKKGNLNQYLP